MRVLSITMSFIFLILTSCFKNSEQPVVPNNPQTNGNGIFAGKVYWGGYMSPDPLYGKEMEGSKIEILGTSIFTTTNEKGDWVMRNLDSGTYSLRITRPGFDTVDLKEIRTNGNDSVYAVWKTKSIDKYGNVDIRLSYRVDLQELPMTIAITQLQSDIRGEVRIHHDNPLDSTKVTWIDTAFTLQGTIKVKTDAAREAQRLTKPYSLAILISDKPTISKSSLPMDSLYFPNIMENNGWYVFNETFTMQETKGIHDISSWSLRLLEYYKWKNHKDIQLNTTQYLHVIPWSRGTVIQRTYLDSNIVTGSSRMGHICGDVVSIPLQWK